MALTADPIALLVDTTFIGRIDSIIYNNFGIISIFRALAYLHNSIGVNPHIHQLKICDFGSAKILKNHYEGGGELNHTL
ncbi:hypothetical protein Ahy_A06g027893 [Arachis hypogaea]|uniref:Protein kinase domain-containing protein n=1 Tax=Arachis hypogaea TaxID=3818 RepID=A0A445CQ60_ARAHY|nr:hypothetical protein Ahy_A06g027893 [Arachis hypogaea]